MTQSTPLPILPRTPSQVAPTSELALTLLGPSAAMSQLWSQIRRLAPYVRTVLLTGKPGCGQEAVARLLLDLSPQNQRVFIRMNAAEADLRLLRPGALVSFPSEVLLYLPEVDRLSRAAQDALLRLMKMRRNRAFTVVAATLEDLRGLVSIGRFSAELADALSATHIDLPALHQRAEDLPMLIGHMLSAYAARTGRSAQEVSEDFLRAAIAHPWPGNLVELTHILESFSSEFPRSRLTAADLHRAVAAYLPQRTPEAASVRMVSIDTVVREHIAAVLRACRGNKLRAAEVLGISRSTLYRTLDATTPAEDESLSLAS